MKKRTTILLIILIITTFILSLSFIKNKVNIPLLNSIFNFNKKENVTTILKSDEDFLEWFNDFNKLYNKKRNNNYPSLKIKKEYFEEIQKLLQEKETNVYYKDGKYYLNNNETLELDVNTRSLRHTITKDNKIEEITEIRLINGLYYIQTINKKYIYRITFNKDNIGLKTYKNDKEIEIKQSIYQTKEFKW